MNILGLGYVGIDTTDIDGWRQFGLNLLSMQVDQSTSIQSRHLDFRIDNKAHRLMIEAGTRNGGAFYGLEVTDSNALHAAAAELDDAGIRVRAASLPELDRRCVSEMFYFEDPVGNRLELYHGLADAASPFQPYRPISGFRTGSQGLGHVVFMVEQAEKVLSFYTGILGFELSDYALEPFKAYFLHANTPFARHHTIALLETGRTGLHHLMLEVLSPDDVGQAYDLALQEEGRIGATLGRHTNDYMTSFYAWSPSKFMIEYGSGGRSIVQPWQPYELVHGPSIWGHDRTWLDSERRAHALELRLGAARAGVRAPLHVLAGSFETFAE